MTVTRLDPPIPLDTSRGPGFAHFLIDYGTEYDLLWQVFLKASGESWCISNRDVRLDRNWSMGIRMDSQSRSSAPVWKTGICTAFFHGYHAESLTTIH